jgi:hypothetical protein
MSCCNFIDVNISLGCIYVEGFVNILDWNGSKL